MYSSSYPDIIYRKLTTTQTLDIKSTVKQNVIARTSAIPVNPSKGDRYLSTTSTAPWVNNTFMTYYDSWVSAPPSPAQIINIETGADAGIYIFNQDLTLSSLSSGGGNYTVSNTAFVDENGSDLTGQIGKPMLPFKTIEAAKNAAIAFGSPCLVWVNPGTFDVISSLIVTAPVNYYFSPTTTINCTATPIAASSLVDSHIYGSAMFFGLGVPIINITGIATVDLIIKCKRMESNVDCILINNPNTNIFVEVDENISATNTAIQISGGNNNIKARYISSGIAPAINNSSGINIIAAENIYSIGMETILATGDSQNNLSFGTIASSFGLPHYAIHTKDLSINICTCRTMGSAFMEDNSVLALRAANIVGTLNACVSIANQAIAILNVFAITSDTVVSINITGAGIASFTANIINHINITSGNAVNIVADNIFGGGLALPTVSVANCNIGITANFISDSFPLPGLVLDSVVDAAITCGRINALTITGSSSAQINSSRINNIILNGVLNSFVGLSANFIDGLTINNIYQVNVIANTLYNMQINGGNLITTQIDLLHNDSFCNVTALNTDLRFGTIEAQGLYYNTGGKHFLECTRLTSLAESIKINLIDNLALTLNISSSGTNCILIDNAVPIQANIFIKESYMMSSSDTILINTLNIATNLLISVYGSFLGSSNAIKYAVNNLTAVTVGLNARSDTNTNLLVASAGLFSPAVPSIGTSGINPYNYISL